MQKDLAATIKDGLAAIVILFTLQAQQGGVDFLKREQFLGDGDFILAFNMDQAQYARKPYRPPFFYNSERGIDK